MPIITITWAAKTLKRSTLSDANARRPAAIFAETFEQLSALAESSLKREGYCKYEWWTRIHAAGSCFVTRPKSNVTFKVVRRRKLEATQGEGFTVLGDAEIKLATQGRAKLAIPLRRVRIKRQTGGILTIITNDLRRSPVEIAAIYKTRWQIELLSRWVRQHLKLRKFLSRTENGIRLQLIAAMIAYLLLRIAARENRLAMPAIRFAQLVTGCLFIRKVVAKIDQPPDVHPSTPRGFPSPVSCSCPMLDFSRTALRESGDDDRRSPVSKYPVGRTGYDHNDNLLRRQGLLQQCQP